MRHDKDKLLVQLTFDTGFYSVRATAHARDRMVTRDVDEYVVIGNVIAFGEKRLEELQKQQEETLIVDERSNVSIVVGFNKCTLHIITVFDRTNLWNNRGTKMVRFNYDGSVKE